MTRCLVTMKNGRQAAAVIACCAVLFASPFAPAADGNDAVVLEHEPQAIEAFADSIIEPALEASGVPGAIVTVVNRDGLLFAGAWGTADLESGTPVTADRTLFDIASIGKTFTAILATQLLDEGVLDIDADVNRYLGDRAVSGGGLTLRQLIGHQARFDRDLSFLFVGPRQDTAMTTGEVNRRLRLLSDPVSLPSYDNRGFGVIGLAAAGVTGLSLAELFESRIFAPLGMRGAAHNVDAERIGDYARCYVPRGPGSVNPCTLVQFRELIQGAGGVALTAEAAGRYMRMLLNGGELDGVRVLSPAAFDELMDFDAYRVHPKLPGLARAFQGFFEPGRQVYGHFGSVPGFTSSMRLYPDEGIGIFMSFMGGQPASFDATLSNAMRYVGEQPLSSDVTAAVGALHSFSQVLGQALASGSGAGDNAPASADDRASARPAGMSSSSATNADSGFAPDVTAPQAIAGRYFGTGPESGNRIARVLRWGSSIVVAPMSESSISLAGHGPFNREDSNLYRHESGQAVAFLPRGDGAMYMASGLSIATLVRKQWWEVPAWAFLPLFASILLLVTGVVYLRSIRARNLQGTAVRATAGALLVIAAAMLELEYGTWLRIERGQPLLPWLWAAALYAGVVFVLLLPVQLLRRRMRDTAGGALGRVALVHISVLALAAVVFSIAVLVLW